MNDLASWRRAIAKIRSLMYRFYIEHLREFRGLACEVDPDPPLEVTVAGTYPPEPLAEFKGRDFRLRERAEHIYNSLHDYDNDGCLYTDYMLSHWWAIAALKWKRTFVVYNEGIRQKQTVVFHWDSMEQKVIVYTYSGVLLSPPYGALCVVCLPDICHYKYLKDRRVSLDQVYTGLSFMIGLTLKVFCLNQNGHVISNVIGEVMLQGIHCYLLPQERLDHLHHQVHITPSNMCRLVMIMQIFCLVIVVQIKKGHVTSNVIGEVTLQGIYWYLFPQDRLYHLHHQVHITPSNPCRMVMIMQIFCLVITMQMITM